MSIYLPKRGCEMPAYFRAEEAAKYLGIGKTTLWKFAKEGKLQATKLSSRVTVFSKSDLDTLVASSASAQS